MNFTAFRIAALIAFSIELATAAPAADKYWIGDSANRTPTSTTPSGTWDTATANWSNVAAGSDTVSWAAGDAAIFSAGTNATGSYTVTVSSTQMLSGLAVEEGNPTFSTGTLNFNATTNTINVATGSTAVVGSTMSTASGNQVHKSGGGTLIVNGTNSSFSGEFVVDAGIVGIGNNSAFGSSLGNSTLTINGGVLAASVANRSLSGNLTMNLSGDFTVSDSVTPQFGQITVNGPATIRNSNRVITVDGAANLIFPNTLGEDVPGRSVTKQGTGTLSLEADPTEALTAFSGNFTILSGKVELTANGRIGNELNTVHFVGGSLSTTGDRSVTTQPISNPLSIEGNVLISTTSTAGTVNLNLTGAFTSTAGASLTFRNEVTTAGTGVFEPRFTTGDTTFSLPIAIENNPTTATRTTRLSSFNAAGTTHTFNGIISGNGGFRRSTGGTTVFTAANTYSGATSVTGGKLLVNNTSGSGTGSGGVAVTSGGTLGGNGTIAGAVTVSSGAHVAPGTSVGTLNVGGLTLGTGAASTSFLNFELGTPGVAAENDLLNVTLTDGLTLNGATVDIAPQTGFGAGIYTLIDYVGSVSGSGVTSLATGNVPGGFNYEFMNDLGSTSIKLKVTVPSAAVPGDYNSNGTVDAADYVLWRKGVQPLANEVADPIATTDADDYTAWRERFGNPNPGTGAGLNTAAAVPEPAAGLLMVLSATIAAWRRPR